MGGSALVGTHKPYVAWTGPAGSAHPLAQALPDVPVTRLSDHGHAAERRVDHAVPRGTTMTQSDTVRASGAGGPLPGHTRPRLTSLDWARGILILANLIAISYVFPASDQLRHPEWLGVTLLDVIFPTFVLLSGCGLAFAYARRVSLRRTLRRMVLLFGGGLVYTAIITDTTQLSELRIFGPLQVYAVLVPVVALLHLVLHRVRAWAMTTVVFALGWTAVTYAFNSSCPTGIPTRSCNLSATIDLELFPAAQLYRQGAVGHDPEGVAAMVGAFVTLMVGVTAGKILLAGRRQPTSATLTHLVGWLVLVVGLGAVTAQLVEPFKRVWSPSFALLSATIGLALLIVGYVLHDQPAPSWWQQRRSRVAEPFVALGRNALVLYFGSHIVQHLLYTTGDPSVASWLRSTSLIGVGDLRWLAALVFVSAFVALGWVLHRRRIYIRA